MSISKCYITFISSAYILNIYFYFLLSYLLFDYRAIRVMHLDESTCVKRSNGFARRVEGMDDREAQGRASKRRGNLIFENSSSDRTVHRASPQSAG